MTLNHLDNLRQTCKQYDLFNLRSIQQALQTVRSLCTDSQKKKFSDLFALADSESEDESNHKPSKQSSKNSKPSKSPAKPKAKSSGGSVRNSESSAVSTESEDELQPPKKGSKGRNAKQQQRKRAIVAKVSYKEMASSDYSTDDEENPRNTPKKRKKM